MLSSSLDKANLAMIRPRRNWTAEEDVILKREVRRVQGEGDNISWHEIAAFLPGRTNKDCRKRWYGTAAAKVKKGPWTEAEDDRLRRAVERHGTKWAVVASVVGTRLPDQCSKRWSHAINPDIDHSPWTPQEDELLIHNVNKHGHYWQQIVSLYFPGRTSLAAKNRYHILQRRLKSEGAASAGAACGLEPMDVGSWQEMLWPSRAENLNLDLFDAGGKSNPETTSSISSFGPNQGTLTMTSDNLFTFEQGRTPWLSSASHQPSYPTPSDFGIDSTKFPFPQMDTPTQRITCRDPAIASLSNYPSESADSSSMPLDCTFKSDISVDDIVLQTASPQTSSSATPLFSPVSLSDAGSANEAKPDSGQRRVCIQAVCSTDKLGAIFEAVTKFSISAVIKTDD
ncbi:hypothetical protein BDW69DRAFT_144386 [Aspergillus filifer]